MKSKILTLFFACVLLLFGAIDSNAQSAKRTITLTKQVTVAQVQKMNVDELIALLPEDTALHIEYTTALPNLQPKDKRKLRDFLRKTLVNHIK